MLNWCGHCRKNTWVRRENSYLSCPGCGRIFDQNETNGYLAMSLNSDYSDQSCIQSSKKKKEKPRSPVDVEESTDSTMPIFNECIESKLDKLIDVVTELVEQEKDDKGLIDKFGEALDELKNAGSISGEAYNAVIVRMADSMGMKKMFLRMNIEDRMSFINFLVRSGS